MRAGAAQPAVVTNGHPRRDRPAPRPAAARRDDPRRRPRPRDAAARRPQARPRRRPAPPAPSPAPPGSAAVIFAALLAAFAALHHLAPHRTAPMRVGAPRLPDRAARLSAPARTPGPTRFQGDEQCDSLSTVVAITLSVLAAVLTAPAQASTRKPDAPASAGWHGRCSRGSRPAPKSVRTTWPPGWGAGAVRRGTGYVRPGGSAASPRRPAAADHARLPPRPGRRPVRAAHPGRGAAVVPVQARPAHQRAGRPASRSRSCARAAGTARCGASRQRRRQREARGRPNRRPAAETGPGQQRRRPVAPPGTRC